MSQSDLARRTLLRRGAAGTLALLLAGRIDLAKAEEAGLKFGPLNSFDHGTLVEQARQLAQQEYAPRPEFTEQQVPGFDYVGYSGIRYRREKRIWSDTDTPFRLELFHPGLYYRKPVALYLVEDGEARRIAFDKALYAYADAALKGEISDEADYVGFRAFYQTSWEQDFVSFLGASYFRAVGASKQFGLSARGISVNTASLGAEEFPDFTDFWIERPAPGGARLKVHALLNGPSITGAYSFTIWPGPSTEMEIEASLFSRVRLDTFGLAVMTSMYYAGENDWQDRRTFREEVHDSDGLAMRRGNDEWLWRPLANPRHARVSTFSDENPRGFGLLQRDRRYESYNDPAHYQDRPNLWIEPQGDWGRGRLELLELPTDDEVFDNIVAAWRPDDALEPGKELKHSYRMWWGQMMPERLPRPAEVAATRLGRAGRPHDRRPGLKFVIDFVGGMLPMLGPSVKPEASITVSRGQFSLIEVVRIPEIDAWRVEFDIVVDGTETVDLRAFLALGDHALTETWLYRLEPGDWSDMLPLSD